MTILGKYINLSTDPVVCTQKSGRKKKNINSIQDPELYHPLIIPFLLLHSESSSSNSSRSRVIYFGNSCVPTHLPSRVFYCKSIIYRNRSETFAPTQLHSQPNIQYSRSNMATGFRAPATPILYSSPPSSP